MFKINLWFISVISTTSLLFCGLIGGDQCSTTDADGHQDVNLSCSCFSPSGADCDWYKQCLARRFDCRGDPSSYALEFGDPICNQFTDWKSSFTELGQRWIDNARECLQRELVPVLSSNSTLSCSAIETFAFRTHSGCYNDPPTGSPAFCDLPLADWFRILWIVKHSFVYKTWETVRQAFETLTGCLLQAI